MKPVMLPKLLRLRWSLLALLVASVFGSGCATTAPLTKTVQIESDPPNMRVEVNNDYIGKTPTQFTVRTNPEGEFLGSWANAPQVEFVAYPPADTPGLYIQKKFFEPNGFFKAGERIPGRLFFDMRLKSDHLLINPPSK